MMQRPNLNSFVISGLPHGKEHVVKSSKYKNVLIRKILKRHNIQKLSDLTLDKNSGVLSEEIVERLFVKNFLKKAIGNCNGMRTGGRNEPDFRIEKDGNVTLTVEVYTPSFTKEVVNQSINSNKRFLAYNSQLFPLESRTICGKINKYSEKYSKAKQTLFIFFISYRNRKDLMQAFYNYYGDTIHSNGSLAHSYAKPYCAKMEMERVAGFFLTEGHLNIREGTLQYRDVIFAHNPFCDKRYRLPFDFFNPDHVFQSYVKFLSNNPSRGERWVNFLIRFYQDKYPDYLFLKGDIRYCSQAYSKLTAKGIRS